MINRWRVMIYRALCRFFILVTSYYLLNSCYITSYYSDMYANFISFYFCNDLLISIYLFRFFLLFLKIKSYNYIFVLGIIIDSKIH